MKARTRIFTLALFLTWIQPALSFSVDGFVPFDTRRAVVEGTRRFLAHFTAGDIEKACDLMWTKDIEIRKQTITSYDGLRPFLPKMGKRKAEHFAGAMTLGEFWLELGYIEVFEEAIMLVRVSFVRPVDARWYVKDINYTVKGDISKLLAEVPDAYKRFVFAEEELR
jgi:hypothetical protein